MAIEFPKRRLFLSEGENIYHVMSFTQSRADSSIYASFPNNPKIKWMKVSIESGTSQLKIIDSPGDGKLSVHGSGMTKISPNEHSLVIHGNYLLDSNKNMAGIRHLFTIQLVKPSFVPPSLAYNRKSDYVINMKKLAPIIIIFFAIPRVKNLSFNYEVSFNVDDLDSVPPEGGAGSFELVLHNIFWYAYRTKYMDAWPNNPYICYLDGYQVPVLIGTGKRKFRAELQTPSYKLSDTDLSIKF
jgi:hypothetical protein